ncbi:MAG: hypoxanthine phosphoribosyltransferase [Xanthobacter sp.]
MSAPNITVLYDENRIAARVQGLAAEIAATDPQQLLAVAVLQGSFMFAADLLRAMHASGLTPEVDFMHLSSYLRGQVSTGNVDVLRDVQGDVRGRDVLLIDDILESGRTLTYAKDLLSARGARRVMVCVLLEKPGKRAVNIQPDFIGFTCPDVFVVGYGMDVAHAFRQLPFIGHIEGSSERAF